MREIINNVSSSEITIREFSELEMIELEAIKAAAESEKEALKNLENEKLAAKESAKSKLYSLGLTEEEIAALIGG